MASQTRLEKDAAAAGLSVEDFQAQQAAARAANNAMTEEARQAEADREADLAEAQQELARLREQLATAEQRAAKADEKVTTLEDQVRSIGVGVNAVSGGTVTTNAKGEAFDASGKPVP
jgi:chromosome segregation ATPase